MDFERGKIPENALNIGKFRLKEKGDIFYAWWEDIGEEIQVESLENEKESHYLEVRASKGKQIGKVFRSIHFPGEWFFIF